MILLISGIFLIASVWKVEIKWVALPVFLIGVFLILAQLHTISLLLEYKYLLQEEEFQNKNLLNIQGKPPSGEITQKIIYYGFSFLFILLTWSISFTGKHIENYLDWKDFLMKLLITGGPISFLFSKIFYKSVKPVFTNKDWNNYVLIYSYAVPFLITFNVIVWYNKLQPSKILNREKIEVTEKGENYLYGNKYIHLTIDRKKIRFEIPKKDYTKIREGDTIIIVTKKGALGIGYVDSFLIRPGS